MRIEFGVGWADAEALTRWPLAEGRLLPADLPWADRRLGRLAGRAAPATPRPDIVAGWLICLERALEPVLAEHRLSPRAPDVKATDTGPAPVFYRRTDGGPAPAVRAWALSGAAPVPSITEADAWDDFLDAVEAGRYFLSHDVLEPWWRGTKSAPMQAAIWVAAGFHQREHGRPAGAAKLFSKARHRIASAGGASPTLIRWLDALIADPFARPDPAWRLLIDWARR